MVPGATAASPHPLCIGRYGGSASVWELPGGTNAEQLAGRLQLAQAWLPAAVKEGARRPLLRTLETVQEAGCQCVVMEERYIDPDYRSEYSAFWSRRFEDKPARARRLHFFKETLDPAQLHVQAATASYLGYAVLRPTPLGPLGRTVVAPPPSLDGAVLTTILERPSLFGQTLEVRGVPFCQQDGEFLVCAHTAAWLCHYVAFHKRIVGRRVTADIAGIPSAEGSYHRAHPSTGLTGEQMQAVFTALGIPALFYDMAKLPKLPAELPFEQAGRRGRRKRRDQHARVQERERILRVVCKYINSGFPVVVLTEGKDAHAFTLVGWQPIEGSREIRLIACDDQVGPYEVIQDPLASAENHRAEWRGLMVPLPEKVFFTGEAAEVRARNMPELFDASMRKDGVEPPPELITLAAAVRRLDGPISLRARLLEGREFKAAVGAQGRSEDVVRLLRMAHLPHWVWLVEMQDRANRADDPTAPCVVADWIFDSTAHDDVPIERLVSLLGSSSDATARQEGQPPNLTSARADGQRWRSLITDPELFRA